MGSSAEAGRVAGDLRIIFGSEIRTNILIAPSEKPVALTDLVEIIGRRAQLILRNIKELEHLNLLENHRNFWLAHDIEALPDSSLHKLGALVNSRLVESTVNSGASINTAAKILASAEERIVGVVSINDVRWKKTAVEAVQKGVKFSVITTKDVFDISGRGDFKKYTKQFLSSPNVDWRINDNIRLALGVTEKAMGLMLYTRDGLPDARRILVSEDPQALKWGEEVYRYYRERSEPLDRRAFLKLN